MRINVKDGIALFTVRICRPKDNDVWEWWCCKMCWISSSTWSFRI